MNVKASKMRILVTTHRGKVLAPSVLLNVLLLKVCKVKLYVKVKVVICTST